MAFLKKLRKIRSSEEGRPSVSFDGETLPEIVAERIASFLDGKDLIHLGKTCRFWNEVSKRNSLWRSLVQRRFGQRPNAELDTSLVNYKELYFKLGASKISVANGGFFVMHLDGHYLAKVKHSESVFGEIIQLNTVCWLQINKHVEGVLPGKYTLFWRMMLHRVYANVENDSERIEFKACPEQGCGTQACLGWSERDLQLAELRHGTGAWFLQSIGDFEVTAKCKVYVEVKGRISWWCGGMSWDYVELRPHEH